MNKLFKLFLVALFAVVGFTVGGTALAGGGTNDSEDDISSETAQTGSSNSGDAVGGQVVGVVSAGDASVDSTNRSEDVDIETGEATAQNSYGSDDKDTQFVGQLNEGQGQSGPNWSDGEISAEVSQDASASTGDGVGGAVIGVVTSAGGSADVVAANTSEDVDIETGNANTDNFLDAFVGQDMDSQGQGGENDSEDDISFEGAQTASSSTGDGVGGQVLGIVSAGDASVDATNESSDVDIETGDAFTENDAEYFVGQDMDSQGQGGENESEAEISSELSQDASANSGDAVAGQVAGVVTSAGGSADLVLANTSEDVDGESGSSDFVNESEEFVGQVIEGDN